MNIFCGSLPWSLEESELKGYFEEYGEVSSVKIITDKFTGKSKGFGFVEMPDEDSARQAIQDLNGADVKGRAIVVNEAEERKNNDRRGGGGGRGGQRSGGFSRGGDRRGGGEYRSGNRY